jgi:hypothetical protein
LPWTFLRASRAGKLSTFGAEPALERAALDAVPGPLVGEPGGKMIRIYPLQAAARVRVAANKVTFQQYPKAPLRK